MFYLRRVVGDSMLPTLKDGQIVFGVKKKPKINSVAIVQLKDREVIKRITKLDNRGMYIEGDNLHYSTDSRNYGYVPMSGYKATIILPRTKN